MQCACGQLDSWAACSVASWGLPCTGAAATQARGDGECRRMGRQRGKRGEARGDANRQSGMGCVSSRLLSQQRRRRQRGGVTRAKRHPHTCLTAAGDVEVLIRLPAEEYTPPELPFPDPSDAVPEGHPLGALIRKYWLIDFERWTFINHGGLGEGWLAGWLAGERGATWGGPGWGGCGAACKPGVPHACCPMQHRQKSLCMRCPLVLLMRWLQCTRAQALLAALLPRCKRRPRHGGATASASPWSSSTGETRHPACLSAVW